MGWTQKLPSGKYQARYRTLNGKYRSAGTFTQKKHAQREADRVENEQRQPTAVDLDGGKIHWGDWFDQWHSSRIVAHSTETNYASTANNHIRPYWGDTKLSDIEPIGVSRWVKTLHTNGASPYTIHNALVLFKNTLNAAVTANRIGKNPAQGVREPTMPEATERFLTRDEVEAITFYLDGFNALVVWTAVQTGMRFGELAGLHWSRLDLDRGAIHVVEKFDQKTKCIDPMPKDRETRTVPLPDDLVDKLRHHRDTTDPDSTCGLRHTAGRCTGDLVFRGPRGAALQSNAWGRGPWKRALALAGIEDRVRPHDMRHTFASWLIQDGVPLSDVAVVMGHSDAEVTRRYAHLDPNRSHDRVRAAIARASAPRRASGPAEVAATVREHVGVSGGAAAHPVESTIDNVAQQGRRSAERSADPGYPALRVVAPDDDGNAG